MANYKTVWNFPVMPFPYKAMSHYSYFSASYPSITAACFSAVEDDATIFFNVGILEKFYDVHFILQKRPPHLARSDAKQGG